MCDENRLRGGSIRSVAIPDIFQRLPGARSVGRRRDAGRARIDESRANARE
jgi:hypothetical protein